MNVTQQGFDCDCLIVGGGFTGLAAAVELSLLGHKIILCESDSSLGGLAGGFDVGGAQLERFYHHWFTSDRHVTAFAKKIGKPDSVLTRRTRTGMYYSGNFYKLSSPIDLLRFKPIPLHDRIRTGLATLAVRRIKNWKHLETTTASDWLVRLFGRTTYEVVWKPLLVGKFGKFADQISAVWFWNKLALRGGSRDAEGNEALSYYRGGFATFARDAGNFVANNGGAIRLNEKVESIGVSPAGHPLVTTSSGTFRPRTVLVTVPLPVAADLIEGAAPQDYIDTLRRIRFLGNVCLVLESRRSLSDLYWVNVNDPTFPFVGIIEHTNFESLDTYGKHIIYLSKYLPTDHELYSLSSEDLLRYTLPYLQRMFPDFTSDMIHQAHVWRAPYAQPIVELDYSNLIPPFETPFKDVFLATMAQVYPEDRGTNYAIREGLSAAQRIDRVIHMAKTPIETGQPV